MPQILGVLFQFQLDTNGEPESFYADGIEYYTISSNWDMTEI